MPSFIKQVLTTLVVVSILVLTIGICLPTRYHIERSVRINAPADRIFEVVNDFRNLTHWSPWANIDPDIEITYTKAGREMIWKSQHSQVGSGSQEIIVSQPSTHILIALRLANFQGEVLSGWKFEEKEPGQTLVTWSNESRNEGGIFSRYMALIINPQTGKHYEKGLRNLKKYVEQLYVQYPKEVTKKD